MKKYLVLAVFLIVKSTCFAQDYWTIWGNSNIVDGTNFIGTIENVPFSIRVHNEKAGRIDPILYNTFWGYQSGNANSTPTSVGIRNTATGYQSLYSNEDGNMNAAFGMSALYSNVSGNYNTATGFNALASCTGSDNTAVGQGALQYTTTSGNTGIGSNALYSNTTGEKNTAVGFMAGETNDPTNANVVGSGNTFIGYNAGPGTERMVNNATAIGYNSVVTGSNSMVLGGIGDDAVNVGIGTTTTRAKLNIYDAGESTTLEDFTRSLTHAGIMVSSDYTQRAYTPGIFWQTADENASKPKAGIWTYQDEQGSKIIMGTSNFYANGITNTGFVMGALGGVGLGVDDPDGLTGPAKLTVDGGAPWTNTGWSKGIRLKNGNALAFDAGYDGPGGYVENFGIAATAYGPDGLNNGGALCFFQTLTNGDESPANYSMIIKANGNVGIGANVNPAYKLDVGGTIRSCEVIVNTVWCDYVFDDDYKLMSLDSVEKYINENKHLPGIPTEKEVEENGLEVGDMQSKQQEKIEELTLYIIEMNKQIELLKEELNILKNK